VNCGGFGRSAGSELFGHKKRRLHWKLQQTRLVFSRSPTAAQIFLDEIGETTPAMQVNTARVKEGEFRRVGETQLRHVRYGSFRRQNRELLRELRHKQFRSDLYWRLGQFPIQIPPLRERRDDIPLLVARFVESEQKETRKRHSGRIRGSPDVAHPYEWPGMCVNSKAKLNERSHSLL